MSNVKNYLVEATVIVGVAVSLIIAAVGHARSMEDQHIGVRSDGSGSGGGSGGQWFNGGYPLPQPDPATFGMMQGRPTQWFNGGYPPSPDVLGFDAFHRFIDGIAGLSGGWGYAAGSGGYGDNGAGWSGPGYGN